MTDSVWQLKGTFSVPTCSLCLYPESSFKIRNTQPLVGIAPYFSGASNIANRWIRMNRTEQRDRERGFAFCSKSQQTRRSDGARLASENYTHTHTHNIHEASSRRYGAPPLLHAARTIYCLLFAVPPIQWLICGVLVFVESESFFLWLVCVNFWWRWWRRKNRWCRWLQSFRGRRHSIGGEVSGWDHRIMFPWVISVLRTIIQYHICNKNPVVDSLFFCYSFLHVWTC